MLASLALSAQLIASMPHSIFTRQLATGILLLRRAACMDAKFSEWRHIKKRRQVRTLPHIRIVWSSEQLAKI
jgi:hypothetical protein